jgi:hypothetical protein
MVSVAFIVAVLGSQYCNLWPRLSDLLPFEDVVEGNTTIAPKPAISALSNSTVTNGTSVDMGPRPGGPKQNATQTVVLKCEMWLIELQVCGVLSGQCLEKCKYEVIKKTLN